jgi:uncharacterized membrane protein (DUF2068 family)
MAKSKKTRKKNKSRLEKELPVGVHMVSILSYIISIFLIFVGILCIIIASSNAEMLMASLGEFGPVIIILLGALFLSIGVLGIFVGRGLQQGKPWARITAVVLLSTTTLLSIYNLYKNGDLETNIIFIVVSLLIMAYLIFSKEVNEIFKKF